MPINHAHLRAFHAVASEGSFTRAARAVHLTQPTLSGQVKALEDRYQVRLLDRRSRGVRLTELGRSLYDLTQRQALIHNEIEQLLTTARGFLSGHLRVSADAPYQVIPLLAAFHQVYPSIRFSLELGNSETELQADDKIRRVVICSGKVYFDLLDARDEGGLNDVYLMRLEQFYPFPALSLTRELARFPNAEIVWCQEEPKNQGAWFFVEPRLRNQLKKLGHKTREALYAGRAISPSTATGYGKQHSAELQAYLETSFTL